MVMNRFCRHRGWLVSAALTGVLAFAAACSGESVPNDASTDKVALQDGAQSSAGDRDGFAEPSSDGLPDSGSASAPADTAPGGASQPALLDRKLIRTATIQIETDAVSQKFEDVSNIALSAGGLVFSSQFGNDGEKQTASITIRVPNDRYAEVLAQLRRLGEVRSEQSNASDVTEEFTDLQSNLNNLQATEREYLKLLTQAGSIDEILTVQDRINSTRAQIEQIQGRINLLGNQTDLATITAHLTPPAVAPDDGGASGPIEVAEQAFDASLATLMGIAVVLIAVAAYSWWLLPLAAIGIYLGRRQVKQDRARSQTPPPAAP
jgi:hypothetical protein